jgi:hypothetical protein
MDALSGGAIYRMGVVYTSPEELSHTAARVTGAGAGRHIALSWCVTQTGREQQPVPLARR